MVEVEESLGSDEARKEEEEEEEKEEEGVVGIRRSGGTKRHVGARRRDLAVVISRLRTEGKSNRCIEKEGPDITHLLYLRLQVPLLLGKRKCTATSPTWLSQGVTPHVKDGWRCRRTKTGFARRLQFSFLVKKQCVVF
jgi:hypothetical protein